MPERKRLLAFHAHPDDESSKGAGTMARYSAEGARVALICATGGEAGEILNPRMDLPGVLENIAEYRHQELEEACRILGVHEIYWLGYRDSGMPGTDDNKHPDALVNADRNEVLERLVGIIRAERPQVMLSYDESRGYEHPDHVLVHELGLQAFDAAGDASFLPEAGPVWSPLKLYYFATFSSQRFMALHEAAVAAGISSTIAERLERWAEEGLEDPTITTQVDVSDYVDIRSKALLAHATQIDPESQWFEIPDEIQRTAYPWEDFTLAASRVQTNAEETDLFEGIEALD
jgi:mycothiol S-conjugate amidase